MASAQLFKTAKAVLLQVTNYLNDRHVGWAAQQAFHRPVEGY